MALVNSWEKQGNFLFKYRGQFPIILFVLSVPFLYFTESINECTILYWNYTSVLVSLVGFLIRFYTIGTTPKGTSGRNTKEQIADYLNSTGIYSLVRHPLYLGNYLIWIGIAIFTYNIYFIIIVSLLFWIYYERIMFAEERFLEKKFGDEYLNWSNGIAAFVPTFTNFTKTIIPLSFKSILRREYAGLLATVIGFAFIDVVRLYISTGMLDVTELMLQILLVTVVVVIVLRSLKHYTSVLNEKDRS